MASPTDEFNKRVPGTEREVTTIFDEPAATRPPVWTRDRTEDRQPWADVEVSSSSNAFQSTCVYFCDKGTNLDPDRGLEVCNRHCFEISHVLKPPSAPHRADPPGHVYDHFVVRKGLVGLTRRRGFVVDVHDFGHGLVEQLSLGDTILRALNRFVEGRRGLHLSHDEGLHLFHLFVGVASFAFL